MKSVFTRLSRPEVDFLIDNCSFSKMECDLLRMASVGNSDVQIAEKLNLSTSSVTKKKRRIELKIADFLEVLENMTTIYVNGKRMTKEELKNTEIQIESVKKILADKLTKTK